MRSVLALGFACWLSACATSTQHHAPDRILVGGVVWTADEARPRATAIAIRGEHIAAVGSDAELLALRGPDTVVEPLDGALVCPGFIDSHLHFLQREQVQIDDDDTLDEVAERVKSYAAARPSQPWITGRGWGYALFPARFPHRRYLDAMLPDRPLVLSERDGHMSVCNTRALALAGITRDTLDPEHGRIVRDAEGEPTGELQESAMGLVGQLVPAASDEELYASYLALQDRAASFGLTSVCNANFSERALELIERARAEGKLKLRFRYAVPFEADASDADFGRWKALEARFPPEWVSFGCAKGMLDGVVDARTAAMFEPFTNGENGIAMWEQGALDATAERYDRAGFQLLFHAIGDRAVSMGLSAFEHVQRATGPRDRRPRIEHAEVVRDADLPRFVATGAIASTQALFATPDATTLENYSPLLGPERARIANAFSRFDDAGVRQAFGSDFPVFSMEVRTGLYVACARKTLAGTPAEGYFPEFALTPEAALRHFTLDGAYANHWEHNRGSLTPGKLADLVVLSTDILSGPPERLLTTRVLATYIGGRPSYRAPQ